MATYVVDASIVIAYLITETYTLQARELFNPLRQPADQFWIPEFCLLECTNVLWKHVSFSGMPIETARQNVVDLLALPLAVIATDEFLASALMIALTNRLAVYDSVYVAMAKKLDCPLISVDQKQARAATQSGVMLKPITDFSVTE